MVPLAVGNYSLKRIYGTGAGTLPADNPKIGLYKSIDTGLGGALATFTDGPFGSLVGLRFLFSPALEPAGVKYYRIKAPANGAGAWSSLTRPVVPHYSHYDSASKSLWFLPYTLRPRTVGTQNGVFEIPPLNPPNKAAEPYAQWYVIDATVDLMNGYFDTTTDVPHGYGFVDFKLEIFDAAGNRVNPATKWIPFRIPSTEDVWGVITTADPATVNPALVCPEPDPADPTKPDLLVACPAAAFSENLYIWNMAFNGWNRVGPDASAVRAFALIPKS